MDVQTTNLQQLRDAIMSIWTKISEECFQHLVESVPRRIKAVLKAKVLLCGSVVEHCVSSAKGCGFDSQGTHILIKNV